MRRIRAQQAFLMTGLFLIMACGGGGACSACESCGIAPIPGGYPAAERIENATQIRLTQGGIAFIEDNIDTLITILLPEGLDFEIPPTSTSASGFDVDVCAGGGCFVHGEVADFELIPMAPNRLQARLQLILDTRNAAGARASLPVALEGLCAFGLCLVDATCQADIDTRAGGRQTIGLIADIDFNEETSAARAGYTRIDVARAVLDPAASIEDADVSFGSCRGSGLGSLTSGLINAVSGLITGLLVDQLVDQVDGIIGDTINDQLCTLRGEFGCPTGTFAVPNENPDSVCRFGASGADECVPILLGTDGQGDLGNSVLGGFSPGSHAPAQTLLAAGGEGEAVNDGLSLFMYGGFLSTSRDFTTSPGHNSCVPLIEAPPLPVIPRVETFRANSVPGLATDPHLSIGVSEMFLNHAGYGMFDSGFLCLGTGTRIDQLLSTGLFSLLISSIGNLTFPDGSSALAIMLRPQKPPVFEIGTGAEGDPILNILLPELQVDFYVWSSERYVRFMTFQSDLEIPINLVVEAGEIVPEITGLTANNSIVTNSELLTEEPEALAMIIQDILTMFADMFTGALSGFALPDIMGIQLQIPEGGIRGIEDGGEEFLGIFAELALAGPMPLTLLTETTLEITDLQLDETAMGLETWGQGEIPSAHLWMDASGPEGVEFEYSWRLNGGQWSRWTTDRHIVMQERDLLFQARHQVEARSRVLDAPASTDLEPAHLELVVDISPPDVFLEQGPSGVDVVGYDVVSPETLEYRYRVNEAAWSEWASLSDADAIDAHLSADVVEAEVRDESGNVGAARENLIRGLPNPDGGGCACSVPGNDDEGSLPFAGLAFLALGFAFLRRRRSQKLGAKLSDAARRRLGVFGSLFVLSLAVGATGCSCGTDTVPGDAGMDSPPTGECGTETCTPGASLCCESAMMCVDYALADLCEVGFQCDTDTLGIDDASCAVTCGSCLPLPPLDPGQLATYLDMTALDDGTLMLSGFAAGQPPRRSYADLVVGAWDPAAMTVNWQIVDGIPADGVISGDPTGWRGGIAQAGDDVGRWTSIGHQGDTLNVAYYDKTNGALKFATATAGPDAAWSIHTVDMEGDSGSFANLTYTAAGNPVVAYLSVLAPATLPGKPQGRARVAMASSAGPAAATDWVLTDVHTVDIPCRQQYCPEGSFCTETSQECVAEAATCGDCAGSDEECVTTAGGDACTVVLPENFVEDLPVSTGLYPSMRATTAGLALVFYDRSGGNLMGSAFDGAAWGAPFPIDGFFRGSPDIGDSGQSADLFVTSDDVWHVAYVDGGEEELRYARIEAGAITRELVDDGSTDGADRHTDGRHIVGDDASIVVTDAGEVRVVYQDATAQRAVLARRGGDGTWAVSVLDDVDSTGYWIEQELVGSSSFIAEWWRRQTPREERDQGVRVMTVE